MNAKKSLIWWIVFIAYFVGVFLAFIKGVQLEATGPKVAWISGALLAACIGVFVAIRLNRAK